MALKPSITYSERLAMAVRKHVEIYGKDNKVGCIVWCPMSGFLVDSFSVDPEKGPIVILYRQSDNAEREIISNPVSDFNIKECKTLIAVIDENADALTYQMRREAMSRQSELAHNAEQLMKQYFQINCSDSKLIAPNKVPLSIDDKKVSCFSFNPEKNKDLGGQYDIVFQGGTTAWVWELSNKGLEKLNAALQQNISLAQKQTKARSNGVKM